MAIIGSILGDIAGSQYEFPITRPTRLDWRYCNLFTDRCKFTDDKYPYGKPQTDEVARGSGNREYGCRRLREKLPNFSGVSFLEPGIPVIE